MAKTIRHTSGTVHGERGVTKFTRPVKSSAPAGASMKVTKTSKAPAGANPAKVEKGRAPRETFINQPKGGPDPRLDPLG